MWRQASVWGERLSALSVEETAVDELGDGSPSLAQEQQELTRARIRDAAMKVVARHGFDATVAEIAELSGVSARTIFRHYKSHDQLILATVKDMYEAWGRRPVEGLPRLEDDPDGWLEGLAAAIHTRSAEIIGEAFWDIHAPSHLSSEVLAEITALRHEYRIGGIHHLVKLAWEVTGGRGEPPEALTLTFALHFSGFATHALMNDFDQTPAQIGELTADILKMALLRALTEQRNALNSPGSTADAGGA